MADFFGDSSLFEEFEKDRETESSFIHYEEDAVKSRIIFEGLDSDSDQDSESETEETRQDQDQEGKTEQTEPQSQPNELTESDSASASKEVCDASSEIPPDNSDEPKAENKNDDGASNSGLTDTVVGKSAPTAQTKVAEKKTERKELDEAAWLNEQLYAAAGEEIKKGNVGMQQLMYQKNKFKRFANLIDSTRCVPDDDSPAVQLLFNNNSFSRKYRQQIEQFIKGLIWQEFHTTGNKDSVQEITGKPGAPSCVEINEKLTPDKRTESMRQRHILLGNCQFHRQFLIDVLGWPFTTKEPTRCNQNWEIPLYGQVFNEVYADPTVVKKPPPVKKAKSSCWNCGQENHSVADCRLPRNPANIAANRKIFMEQGQQTRTEPKFKGLNRYHLDPEIASKFNKFSPGVLSEGLREALGLKDNQLPKHIYKMRLFGYPPGWLEKAKQVQSGVSIFDKAGRATLITGETLEDGEVEDGQASADKREFDVNRIIEYPGFTVPVPEGFEDEHEDLQMPPIQEHQLKETLRKEQPEKPRKRKREKDEEEKAKDSEEAKKAKSSTEEGEAPEGEEKEASTMEEGEETETQPQEEGGEEKAEEVNDTQPLEDEESSVNLSAQSTPLLQRSSSSTKSLSRDFGTPILVRNKSDLPDASKFSVGVEDHINFENLPNSTGTFEKMRNLIGIIRKKIKN